MNNWRYHATLYGVVGTANAWDDGYPKGGNYWSDYQAIYPYASEIDSSGIWNTPYEIVDIIDHYPLMKHVIIPEFQSPIILLLLMGATTLAIMVFRRHKTLKKYAPAAFLKLFHLHPSFDNKSNLHTLTIRSRALRQTQGLCIVRMRAAYANSVGTTLL